MSKLQFHAYVLIAILGLAVIGAKSERRLTIEGRPDTDFGRIPMELKGWSGIEGDFGEETKRLLPSASLLLRYYMHDDYPVKDLAIVYGTDLGDFHQPEVCLEGQGLRTLNKGIVKIRDGEGGSFDAVSLIMDSFWGKRAFIFWFASEDENTISLGHYKIQIFIDRLMGKPVKPSAMIRIGSRVPYSDEEAIENLVHFAEAFAPYFKEEFESD